MSWYVILISLLKKNHISNSKLYQLLNSINPVDYDEDPYIRSYEISSSLFPFTEFKPSLGPLHAQYIDLSVLLSKQPHHLGIPDLPENDMEEYPPEEPDAAELDAMMEKVNLLGWKEDYVIEVLGDRYGPRSRSWGAFIVVGYLILSAFAIPLEPNEFGRTLTVTAM